MSRSVKYHHNKIQDLLRPTFHFVPPQNWMNDPNGLVKWQGKYHLFYQHNPHESIWGNIHWGHAMSDDLIHWQHMPIALEPTPNSPDERGVWSGSLVNNDGIATILYTGVTGGVFENQTICVATSQDDDLTTWVKYEHNPIDIDMPPELTSAGFRDPYVWRQDGVWKMIIGTGASNGCEAVLLYESETLYDWQYVCPLLINDENNDHVYECPNFFKLGDKWVLIVSRMPMSHVEYFVGIFWNNHFIVETHGKLGEGPLYAPLTFEDDKGRRILISWIREARSDRELQQAGWAGVMSTPVELMLMDNNQLCLTPIREILDNDLTIKYYQFHDVTINDLSQIQERINYNRLKIVISDDLSKVIFLDGSLVEYFDFPDYIVRRVYDNPADLTILPEFVSFPLKRIGIWFMPPTI